ncbi:family 76 putative glycoside hydrolase [Podospora australis]|uniref:Mannan endo-1,6-alpha-mannosidase n=1 Tax=Podospora australis TaxID=1536484 RepID=A0AAN6WNA0_9PEZI|nr:family 76 putative glycoside hydrolase [Podospora australis]
MVFVKSIRPAAVGTALIAALAPKDLNISDPTSIKGVAKTIAANTMSYYTGTETKFADLPQPHYWWQAGALMGSMLDYSHYTGDTTYDKLIARALLDQVGPDFNYMLPSHFGQEGNDDQAFWGFSVLSAAETNFPHPDENVPSWLTLGENLWNSLHSRWGISGACNGGLLWQIFPQNPNGLDYINTVSNGGFFQISARLARATGNKTYADWAEKIYDWTEAVGMIDASGNVHDGASAKKNCTDTNPLTFSYSAAIYLYGAAVMADVTADQRWTNRATKILDASKSFFGPFPNATNIMYEHACEQVGTCNADMRSFKAYFSRFAYKSTVFVPSLQETIQEFWWPSVQAAVKTCADGTRNKCGQRWYTQQYDGRGGLGEEMSALETVQGLLVGLGQTQGPLKGDQIKTVREFGGSAASKPEPTKTAGDKSASAVGVEQTEQSSRAASVRRGVRMLRGWSRRGGLA